MFFLQLSGVPGSGKSTLAMEIAKTFDVIIIDHDVTKSALMESDIVESIAGAAAYHVDYAYVNYYLSQGRNVIMDSPCFYDIQLKKSMEAAKRNQAGYKYIECYLSDMVEIDRRLKSRERKISQLGSVESYKATREEFEKFIDGMKRPDNNFLIVDSSQPIAFYINNVIQYLGN